MKPNARRLLVALCVVLCLLFLAAAIARAQPAPPVLTATLTVVATGAEPLSYQWYQGSAGVTTIPVGTNSPTFTTGALSSGKTSFWVRVSNPFGSVDSNVATITVGAPPVITGQPASQTLGTPLTFALTCPTSYFAPADANGGAVILYQTATSAGVAPIATVCTPPSGTRVQGPTGTVSCTATDAAQATATCTFPVTIR